MPTKNAKRIGSVALVAMLAAALVAATAPGAMARHGEDHPVVPGGQASNNCTAEFTLSHGTQDSGSLDRLNNDVEDTWVVDVPDVGSNRNVFLDIDETATSQPLEFELYDKDSGSCGPVSSGDVEGSREDQNLDDDQKYWIHVELKPDSDIGDYTILMDDE